MKNSLLILTFYFLSSSGSIMAQTPEIEKATLAKRFQEGEFDALKYKQMAELWHNILNDLEGYPELPYDTTTKTIVFERTLRFEGISKQVIFERIIEWAAINFGSLDAVVDYKNMETGKIILKGFFAITYKDDVKRLFAEPKEVIRSTKSKQTYIFTVKDGALKIQVRGITYQFTTLGYLVNNTYFPERTVSTSIHSLYPITSRPLDDWKSALSILNETHLNIKKQIYTIARYVENCVVDYKF